MIRLIRAEFSKLRTTRVVYGMAAAMAAFALLTVVAGIATPGGRATPRCRPIACPCSSPPR